MDHHCQQCRCSIVVSIPACHAGDPGSIPGNGDLFCFASKFKLSVPYRIDLCNGDNLTELPASLLCGHLG